MLVDVKTGERRVLMRGAWSLLVTLSMVLSLLPGDGLAYAIESVADPSGSAPVEEVAATSGADDEDVVTWRVKLDANGGSFGGDANEAIECREDVDDLDLAEAARARGGVTRENYRLVGWATTGLWGDDGATDDEKAQTQPEIAPADATLRNLAWSYVELADGEQDDRAVQVRGARRLPVGSAYAVGDDDGNGHVVREASLARAAGVVEGGDVTLYAVWAPVRITVEFDANGGEGEMAPVTVDVISEDQLPSPAFAREGSELSEWRVSGTETVVALDANVRTLVAALESTPSDGDHVTLLASWTEVDVESEAPSRAGPEGDPVDSEGTEQGESEPADDPEKAIDDAGDTKTDDTKTDDVKTDDAKSDDAKTDDTKVDDTKADDTKTDGAKTDDAKTDGAKTDDAKSDDDKTDDDKTDDAKSDDAKTDDAKTDDDDVDAEASVTGDGEAVTLMGEAASNADVAVRKLEGAGVSSDRARTIVANAFVSPSSAKRNAPTLRTSAPTETLPRQLDGSNIETIACRWITADTVDNGDDALLYRKPSGDASQSVRMRINYALSGEHPYEAGDVQIMIPANMFAYRDGTEAGTLYIPYPEDPKSTDDYNWRRVERDGEEYVILTNTRRMSAATKGYIEFAIEDLVPHRLVDMGESEPFWARIQVQTHRGNSIALTSNEITAVFDTEERVDVATKYETGSVSWVGAESIPEEQRVAGESDYVVVTYYMYGHVGGNTEGRLVRDDVILDSYDGFIIGETDATPRAKSDEVYDGWNPGGTTGHQTVRVAYPGSQFEPNVEYRFGNRVTYTLTETDPAVGDDPRLVTDASDEAWVPWSWHEPQFVTPTGHFMVNKMGNDGKFGENTEPWWTHRYSYDPHNEGQLDVTRHNTDDGYGYYEDALNELADGADVELGYTVESIGYILPWTLDGDARLQESYGRRPVTMVTYDTDDTIAAGLTISGIGASVPLQRGRDWDWVGVEFPKMPSIGRCVAVNVNPDGSFSALHAGDGTFTYASDSDVSKIPPVTLEAFVGGRWVRVATADWSSGSLALTCENGASREGACRVNLPEGTEQVRTSVTATNAYIWYYMRPIVNVMASGAVGRAAKAGFQVTHTPEVDVTNSTYMKAYDADGEELVDIHKTGMDELHGYTTDVEVYPTKTSAQSLRDVDYDRRLVTVHYKATVDERTHIPVLTTYRRAVADGRLVPDEEGVWRDLLPLGMEPVLSTVKLRDNDDVVDAYAVHDWRGSGRTLLVVRAHLTPQPSTWRGGSRVPVHDELMLSFDATYPFDMIRDLGDEVHNVVSYESLSRERIGTVENYGGEADDPRGEGNVATRRAFADDAERDAMTGLDPERDGERFVYAGNERTIDILSAARTSLDKQVETNYDNYWSSGTYDDHRIVWEGGTYRYVLRMISDADTRSKDLVIYDSLENFHAGDGNDSADIGAPRWQGTLEEVDVSQLEELGVAPVVWYSTRANLRLANELRPDEGIPENLELKAPIWVRASEYTGAMSDVKAIAIDCSKMDDEHGGGDFVLEPLESASAKLVMRAPAGDVVDTYVSQSGAWGDSAHAYNNAYLTCTSIDANVGGSGSESFVRKDYTKVGIKRHDVEVVKTWDDDDDRDGLRADSVTVHLLADGVDTGRSATLGPNDDESLAWRATFEHVPYSTPEGEPIHYTVSEEFDHSDAYRASQLSLDGSVLVRNRHAFETVSVEGEKTWVGDDADTRPSQVTVRLLADGEEVARKVVRARSDGSWSYSFGELPRYRDHGQEISYEVTDEVEDYATTSEGFDLTNTWHPYGDLKLSKSVTGQTAAFADRRFAVRLSLTGEDGEPLTGEYAWESSDGRSGTVGNGGSLRVGDGESVTVRELPARCSYELVEDVPSGYSIAASSGLSGTVRSNAVTEASIENAYHAIGRTYVNADKTLSGRVMSAYQFLFELSDATTGAVVKRGASLANGSIEFGALAYTEADAGKTYTYRITETDRGRAGYTYDTGAYLVSVRVTDNGDGTLSCDRSYRRVTGETSSVALPMGELPAFANTYEATGEAKLTAWKRLEGGQVSEGQFSFELLDEDGTVVATASNDARGVVTFPAISFDQDDVGSHGYVVREVAGNDPDVTYDDSIYGYKVTVVDNGDGTLTCSTGYAEVRPSARRIPWAEVESADRDDYVWHVQGTNVLVTAEYPDLERTGELVGLTRAGLDFSMVSAPHRLPLGLWNLSTGFRFDAWNKSGYWVAYFCGAADDDHVGKSAIFDSWRSDVQGQGMFFYPLNEEGSVIVASLGVPTTYAGFSSYANVPESYICVFPLATVTSELENGTGFAPAGSFILDGGYGTYTADDLFAVIPSYEVTESAAEPPVFVNRLEDGSLAITKLLDESTPEGHEGEEFTFHVQLTGEGLPETLEYDMEDAAPSGSVLGGVLSWLGTLLGVREAYAADIASGTYAGVDWRITEDGELIIGNGGTQTFAYDSSRFYTAWSWYSNRDKVKTIRFNGTVNGNGSMFGMFYGMSNVTSIDTAGFDTSNVTNMGDMFYGCRAMTTPPDTSGWDTSNVTSMRYMFYGCNAMTTPPDTSGWDTSNVTGMGDMFANCHVMTTPPDTSGWDMSNVTSISYMFYECNVMTTPPDTSGWVTSNVTNMRYMFDGCYDMTTSPDTSGWDTSNVTRMDYMFYDCRDMTTPPDTSSWDTSNVTDMDHMFFRCYVMTELDISSFDTSNVTKMSDMFAYCSKLSAVTLGENFSFKGNGSTSATLPTPPSATTTVRWINLDKDSDALTPAELRDQYDGSPAMTGTWVWQTRDDRGVVHFDSHGGTQAADVVVTSANAEVTMPSATQVTMPSSDLTLVAWTQGSDGSGMSYAPGETYTGVVGLGSSVTLHAQWGRPASYVVRTFEQRPSRDGWDLVSTEVRQGMDGAQVTVTPEPRSGFSTPAAQTVTLTSERVETVDVRYPRTGYGVTYDGNGATAGNMASQAFARNVPQALSANAYVREGHVFTGWNTRADGSGTAYTDGQRVSNLAAEGGVLTLYAQWLQLPTEPVATDGTIEVGIRGNEVVELRDLPAGTTYSIEETDLPGGWSLVGIEGADGTITAAGTSEATITNSYAATGEASIQAWKRLVGRTPADGEFEFVLYEVDGSSEREVARARSSEADTRPTITDPDTGATAINEHFGMAPVTFGEIAYDEPGTYNYVIREVAGSDPSLSYDDGEVRVIVTVAHVGGGMLACDVSYEDGRDYLTNEVKKSTLEVSKSIAAASDPAPAGATFGFDVRLVDATGAPLSGTDVTVRRVPAVTPADVTPEGETPSSSSIRPAEGQDLVEFDANGGHFLVGGEAYETNFMAVTSEDERLGTYVEPSPADDAHVFGGWLEGGEPVDWSSYAYRGGANVRLVAAWDEVEPDAGEVVHVTDGTLELTMGAGETVVVEGLPHGCAYEVAEHEREGYSLVGATGASGTLRAGETSSASFTNSYHAEGSFDLEGTKTLTGRALVANEFSFELIDVTGGIREVVATATNDAEGRVQFTDVPLSAGDAGTTRSYVVREVAGDEEGVTYDDEEKTVTVVVSDDGAGNVTGEVSGASPSFAFENTWARSVEANVRAWKHLTGREQEPGEFEFELLDEMGEVVARAASGETRTSGDHAGDSLVLLGPITYGAVGAHTYRIREVAGDDPTMTYDDSEHRVTVIVTEEASTHKLSADVTYADGAEPTFVNSASHIVTLRKAWVDEGGNTVTPPTGSKATFELVIDGTPTGRRVELDGVADAVVTGDRESEPWVATFTGLDGTLESVTIRETSCTAPGDWVAAPVGSGSVDVALPQSGDAVVTNSVTEHSPVELPQTGAGGIVGSAIALGLVSVAVASAEFARRRWLGGDR